MKKLWDDEVGDCRQEIVFIGFEMNREQVEAKFDAGLVSDAESGRGGGLEALHCLNQTLHSR